METVNETIPPTEPPPFRHPGQRLTRATDDKVVSGLAGGLGRYFGIDPVVFRVAFVVLALAGGSGVLLYLAGWLMIPDERGGTALRGLAGRERNQKLVAAVVAGIGVLVLLDQVSSRGDGDIPVGLVLVGIGALVLWNRHRDETGPPPGAGGPEGPGPFAPPPPPPPLLDLSPPEAPTPPNLSLPEAEAQAQARAPKAPKAPKPRSALLPATVSLLAVLAGGLTLIGVSAATGVALALLVTGGALVVGAWRGRARWLIPVGLGLSVTLAAVSLVDGVPVRGGSGDVSFRPLSVADVSTPYRLAAGHLTVDLGALDLAGSTVVVVASVAAGDLEIVLPISAALELDTHVGAGDINALDRHWDGLDVTRHLAEPGTDGGGRLVVRARTGVGAIEVRRAAA